eukprot:scaffold20799_cov73-Cylindrotheca_fusiformis.AAC.3
MDKGSHHMGRWSFVKYAGKAGKVITVVTAYQVCVRPTNEVGNMAFHQQVQHIATEAQQSGITISAPQPRLRFRTDLLKFLHELKRSGESIILMGDFNEDIGDSRSKLQRLFQDDRLKLVDIIGRQHPSTLALPTYIRGSKRLDFILLTEDLIPAVRRCGYLPFHDHFRSDHRFAFIDFDQDILFGPSEAQLAPHMFREFRSNDPKQVEKYLLFKYRLLQDSNFFPRLQTLCDSDEPDHHLAEKLDACWVHASLTAAKHCKKRRREWWSIPLHQALEEKSLLQTHLTGLRMGHDFSQIIERRLQEFNLPDLVLPDTISETNAALKQVQLRIKQIRANSKSVREQSLIEQAREIRYMQKKSDAEILEILKKKELQQAARWQKIGFLQGKNRSSQFTKVEVPLSWPRTQEEFLNPDQIIENPKDCLLWRSIEDPSEVEFYIQMRNRLHFGQAQGTPFTTGSLQDDINWGASSLGADSVLLGRYRVNPDEYCTFDDNEEESPQEELLRKFLAACHRSPEQRTRPLIMPEVSLEELIGRIKVWNERTTTSPSGLHLGHLKSLTARLPSPESDSDDGDSGHAARSDGPTSASAQKQLLHAQLQLINYGLKHGYAYKRWKNVVNVMIQKETGNNKIHRLRVIHLYEADLGATFAILWKKMFASAERHHDINDSQYGGRHGHEAAYLPYAEELKYDLCRLSRKPLVNFDNDAQSCYDRIIPSVASLLGRYHGLHPNITAMHGELLQHATFRVKTSLGVSTESYQHSAQFPIYGTGQGSTNSPIIWSMISSKLFDIHHQQAHGASFCTPHCSICVQESAFGFVDDTTCQTNDFLCAKPMSVDSLVQTATADAQIWSSLLYISGGLLELPKCSVHIVFPKFYSSGKPYLCKPRDIPPIHLPNPRDLTPIEISCHPPDLEHKTLGHYKAPTGHLPKQHAALQKAADALATMIL